MLTKLHESLPPLTTHVETHVAQVSTSEVQRVFHSANLPPLPMHGLPAKVATLHGIDYRALAALSGFAGADAAAVASGSAASAASADTDEAPATLHIPARKPEASEAMSTLRTLAQKLSTQHLPWEEAFMPFDRNRAFGPFDPSGLVGPSDLDLMCASRR